MSELDLAAIRARHVVYDLDDGYPDICYQDSQDWPCDAAQLLTALAEAEAAVEAMTAERDALAEDEQAATGRAEALEAALRDIYQSEPKSGSWDGWRESTRLRNIAQAALTRADQ